MSSPRVLKLADQIKVIVAEMLERRIKDPRLGFVTVTDVRLTGDAQNATVFYTVFGSADIVVLLVDHDQFKTINRSLLAGKVLYDTRGAWR